MSNLQSFLKPQQLDIFQKNDRDNISEYRPKSSYSGQKPAFLINKVNKYSQQKNNDNSYQQAKRIIIRKVNNTLERCIEPTISDILKERSTSYNQQELINTIKKQQKFKEANEQIYEQSTPREKTHVRQQSNPLAIKNIQQKREIQSAYHRKRASHSHYNQQDLHKNIHSGVSQRYSVPNFLKNQQEQDQFQKSQKFTKQNNFIDEEPQKIDQNRSPQNKNEDSSPEKSSSQHKTLQIEEDQDRCFKIDYDYLQHLSPNDPKLQELFNDQLLNNKNISLDELVRDNADYFHHLLGNCACYKCRCARCKCHHGQSSKFKNTFKGLKSSYDRFFDQKGAQFGNIPALNQTHYESSHLSRFNPLVNTKLTETREYYKEHPIPKKAEKTKFVQQQRPIMKFSSYQNNFQHWQDYDPNWTFSRPQQKCTVGADHPINANSNYQNTHLKDTQLSKIKNDVDRDVKRDQYVNPIPDCYRDDKKESQYGTNHKSHDAYKNHSTKLGFKWHSETDQFHPIPSFYSQFKTTFQSDYQGNQDNKCEYKFNHTVKKGSNDKIISALKNLSDRQNTKEQHY